MKERNRIFTILLAIMMAFSYMPELAYAAAGDDPKEPAGLSAAGPEMMVPDAQMPDNAELLEQYFSSEVDKALGRSVQKRILKSPRKDRLNSVEQYMYEQILAKMQAVASGDDSSAVLYIDLGNQLRENGWLVEDTRYPDCPWAITRESLGLQTDAGVYIAYEYEDEEGEIRVRWGFSEEAKKKLFDTRKVVDAILLDQPYYAYWFDIVSGFSWHFNSLLVTSGTVSDAFFEGDPVLRLSLTVAEDYRADGGDEYVVDTGKTGSTAAAVEHAEDIVEANSGKGDLEKLYAYKDKICDLTSYNYDAADDPHTPYGDPWQLIYVFDGDEKTNVVCEGYSKAFKFLCDKTVFGSDEIDCNLITGDLTVKDGDAGGHMWNTLHMDDGRNYIADITNCDPEDPRAGYPDDLFLKGYTSGSVEDGYTYDNILHYQYDSEAFAQYDYEELEMSADNYIKSSSVGDSISFARDGYSKDKPIELTEGGEYSYKEGGVYKYVCPLRNGDRLIVNKGADNVTVYEFLRTHTGMVAEELFVNSDDPDDVLEIPGEVSWDSEQSKGVSWRPGDSGEFILKCMDATCSIYVKIVKGPDSSQADAKAEEARLDKAFNGIADKKIRKVKGLKKYKQTRTAITVKWTKLTKKKLGGATKYEIWACPNTKFRRVDTKVATVSKSKSSGKVKGLKKNTKYYVKVRAVRYVGGVKYVGPWSSRKMIRTKK